MRSPRARIARQCREPFGASQARRNLLRKDRPDGQRKTSEELRASVELTTREMDQYRQVWSGWGRERIVDREFFLQDRSRFPPLLTKGRQIVRTTPPEGAALYEVTESISRFCQRKVLATIGLIAPDCSRETMAFQASVTVACG